MAERSVIEQYLEAMENCLRLPRKQKARVLAEVEDHLREAVATEVACGADSPDVERTVTARFGNAAEFARSLNDRRLARVLAAIVALGLLAEAVLWPGSFVTNLIGARAFSPGVWEFGFLNTAGTILLLAAGAAIGFLRPRGGLRGAAGLGAIGAAWVLYGERPFVQALMIYRGIPGATFGWHAFRDRRLSWGYAAHAPNSEWIPLLPVSTVALTLLRAAVVCSLVLAGALIGAALRRRAALPNPAAG